MSQNKPLFVGLDLGTSNAKVACYDLDGNLHARASHAIPTKYPAPGFYEQNPREWISGLIRCLKLVTSQLGSKSSHIRGLSLSNFGPGLVMISDGQAIAPCPTWQDERCWDQGQRLIQEVGPGWIGFGVPQTGFPARVLYALENQPDLAAKTEKMYDIKAFLVEWLTGKGVTDPSSGPGANGWHQETFEFIGWPIEKLPPVKQSTERVGLIREELAVQTGLPKNLQVFTGLNDGAAATAGSGVINLGDCIITMATNGVVRLVIPEKIKNEILLERAMFSWPFIDGLWICGGSTLSGAGSLQWFADLFDIPNTIDAYHGLLEEAACVPPGSRGVVFLPYLSGRGTPDVDTKIRGGFLHLGLEHNRGEMLRALLEGISFAIAEIFFELQGFAQAPFSVRITGGGARSELWQQIISDVLNSPITHAGGDATLGCAMVAAVGLNYYPSFAEAANHMVNPISSVAPDQHRSNEYREIFNYFSKTRNALSKAPHPRNKDGIVRQ
jgi:xylulokinase